MIGARYNAVVKRWVLGILVLLLIGAVINVLVAWGCVRFLINTVHDPDGSPEEVRSFDSAALWWRNNRPDGFTTDFQAGYGKQGTGIERTVYVGQRGDGEPQSEFLTEAAVFHRAGWPMLSLQGEKWSTDHHTSLQSPDDRVTIEVSLRWGWEADAGPGVPADAILPFYPVMPIWFGFLVNTVFYGWVVFVILFTLTVWPVRGRQWLRRRRGRCPMCAYDLRGDLDGGCPECGWNREEVKA